MAHLVCLYLTVCGTDVLRIAYMYRHQHLRNLNSSCYSTFIHHVTAVEIVYVMHKYHACTKICGYLESKSLLCYKPLGLSPCGRRAEIPSTSIGSLTRDLKGSCILASDLQGSHQGPPPTSTAALVEVASKMRTSLLSASNARLSTPFSQRLTFT